MMSPWRTLRSYHRQVVWSRPLWLAAVGIGAAASIRAARMFNSAGTADRAWLGIVSGSVALALAARLLDRRGLRDSAQALDRRFGTRNRLEALAEVAERSDALAAALRSETAAHFAGRRIRPAGAACAWWGGWLAILGVAFLGLAALRSPHREAVVAEIIRPSTRPHRSPPAAAKPESAAPPPAALRWTDPDGDITAPPEEIVPLTAQAASRFGLGHFVLHVSVNGAPAGDFATAAVTPGGRHPVDVTLALAPLKAVPGDLVGYYLTAEQQRRPAPTVYSPLQLVRIRRLLQDEPVGNLGGRIAPGLRPLVDAARRIEADERTLLAASFDLSQAADATAGAPAGAQPADVRALAGPAGSLAGTETRMAGQAADLESAGQRDGLTPSDEAPLDAARQAMRRAAADLGADNPAGAEAPILRALAMLPRFEAAVQQSPLAPPQWLPPAHAPNPGILGPASVPSPVGRLEQIAQLEQQWANGVLQTNGAQGSNGAGGGQNGPASSQPNPSVQSQESTADELDQLARASGASPALAQAARQAARQVEAAAQQLNEGDAKAAAQPAAEAAERLREATDQAKSAGLRQANAALQDLQRALIQTAEQEQAGGNSTAAGSAAAQQVSNLAQQLDEQAREESQFGSPQAAQSLQDLANQMQSDAEQDTPSPPGPDGAGSSAESGGAPGDGSTGAGPGTGPSESGSGFSGNGPGTGAPAPGETAGSSPGTGEPDGNLPSQTQQPGAGRSSGSFPQSGGYNPAGSLALAAPSIGKGNPEAANAPGRRNSKGRTADAGRGAAVYQQAGPGGTAVMQHGTKSRLDSQTVLSLAQAAVAARVRLGGKRAVLDDAFEGLRRDAANVQRAAGAGPDQKQDLLEDTIARLQQALSVGGRQADRLGDAVAQIAAAGTLDPGQSLGGIIQGAFQLVAAARASTPRVQAITLGTPDDAPAPFRSAVAAYFEGLAAGSRATPGGAKPNPAR